MGTYEKQQLRESLGYIEIVRGTTRPTQLAVLLERRMEAFMERKLKSIAGGPAVTTLEDL